MQRMFTRASRHRSRAIYEIQHAGKNNILYIGFHIATVIPAPFPSRPFLHRLLLLLPVPVKARRGPRALRRQRTRPSTWSIRQTDVLRDVYGVHTSSRRELRAPPGALVSRASRAAETTCFRYTQQNARRTPTRRPF